MIRSARAFFGTSTSTALLLLTAACGGGDDGGGNGTGGGWTGEPGSIWLTASYDDTLNRIDTATGKTTETHDITSAGTEPTSLALGAGSVWFTLNGHEQLSRLTPDRKPEKTDCSGAYEVAFGEGSVWASAGALFVCRVDASSGAVIATIQTQSGIIDNPITVGGGSAWVAAGSSIDRIDAATNQVTASIPIGASIQEVMLIMSTLRFSENTLWLLTYHGTVSSGTRTIVKIDPATNAIVKQQDLDTDGADDSLAIGFGSLWVSSEYGHKLIRVSPATLEVEKEYPLPDDAGPTALTVGNKYVYASDFGYQKLWQIDPTSGNAVSVSTASGAEIAFEP